MEAIGPFVPKYGFFVTQIFVYPIFFIMLEIFKVTVLVVSVLG